MQRNTKCCMPQRLGTLEEELSGGGFGNQHDGLSHAVGHYRVQCGGLALTLDASKVAVGQDRAEATGLQLPASSQELDMGRNHLLDYRDRPSAGTGSMEV
jgi:hypothetical protein